MREGAFSLFAMAHTMAFDGPAGREETVPWDGSAVGGPFSYASKPCSGEAPVNNVSTDLPALGGVVAGSRVPVSTRTHPLRFHAADDGGILRLRGSVLLTVCQLGPGPTTAPDPVADGDKPRISVDWDAAVDRRAAELVTWRGAFAIVGGTGRYEGLRGEGDIAGYFFCSDPAGCVALGTLRDCQYAMIGSYRIPGEVLAEWDR